LEVAGGGCWPPVANIADSAPLVKRPARGTDQRSPAGLIHGWAPPTWSTVPKSFARVRRQLRYQSAVAEAMVRRALSYPSQRVPLRRI